ncbi:hypothetical protein C0991_011982 [Blastosporella zonata]|nr:hypothetical protein C0991_011982 [Blastosporella zonata]
MAAVGIKLAKSLELWIFSLVSILRRRSGRTDQHHMPLEVIINTQIPPLSDESAGEPQVIQEPPELPPELVHYIMSEHVNDRNTLSTFGLISSWFRTPSQKKLFRTITMHVGKNTQVRNARLGRIIARNPRIATYILHLMLFIHDDSPVPNCLQCLSDVQEITLAGPAALTPGLVIAIQNIIVLSSLRTVNFGHPLQTRNFFPVAILKTCSGSITTLRNGMPHPFINTKDFSITDNKTHSLDGSNEALLHTLDCSSLDNCKQMKNLFNFQHLHHFLTCLDRKNEDRIIQNIVDGASKSLRMLDVKLTGTYNLPDNEHK